MCQVFTYFHTSCEMNYVVHERTMNDVLYFAYVWHLFAICMEKMKQLQYKIVFLQVLGIIIVIVRRRDVKM